MKKVKLTEAAVTGPHHHLKGLELQPKRISMQARTKRGVPHGPAAGPGHGARRRLAGAVTLATPWTTNSHHMVHVELQAAGVKAKSMTRGATLVLALFVLGGRLVNMKSHAQHIHDAAAQMMIDDRGGLQLQHVELIILLTAIEVLPSSHALHPKQWPLLIPRC